MRIQHNPVEGRRSRSRSNRDRRGREHRHNRDDRGPERDAADGSVYHLPQSLNLGPAAWGFD
jgi:hypothetical protein